MIEMPEAVTLSRQFSETLTGKTITNVVVGSTPHGFAGYGNNKDAQADLLRGKSVTGAKSFGGQAEIEFEDVLFTINDGINPRLVKSDGKLPAKHQYLIEFDSGDRLVCTVQMYGFFGVRPKNEAFGDFKQVALDKPSPLTDAFHRQYFENLFDSAKKSLSVKAFLATEQRIPGLGNGVLQDILFRAGLNPRRKLSALLDGEIEAMFTQVKETLALMTKGGGRDTEKDFYGNPGEYRCQLSSKTLKSPCPVCGDTIVRQAYLGGNVYFCPTCQPID